MGLSNVVQYWSNALTALPGMTGVLLAVLALAVFAVILGVEAARRREVSMHLQALAEAMDEQSRLMERMRRSLTDIMEVLVSLESETRYRGQSASNGIEATPDVTPPNPALASALRAELESLKAEMSAELPVGPTLD